MLVAVIGVFVALTAAVLVWIPPSEANDEPDHVQNVVTLARGDWYLIEPGTGTEVNQPPAYYIALAAWHRALGLEPKVPAPPNRGLAALAEPGGVFWHNYPGHDDDERQVRLLRLPSIACGVATILLTYACARRLSRDPWTPVAAAATRGLHPEVRLPLGRGQQRRPCERLAALLAFLLVCWVTHPPAPPRASLFAAGLMGLVYRALVLTKVSTVPLVLALVLALVLVVRSWGERSLLAGAAALATGLVCGSAGGGLCGTSNERAF